MGPPTAASADGVAYPSKQGVAIRFEPSAPPSPVETPHKAGVGWAGDIQVHTFDRESQSGNRPQEVVAHFIPDFVMTLRTHISTLRWLGLLVCAFQIAGAIAIPLTTYLLVTKNFARYAIEDYVHWGISLVAGAVGMLALGSMQSGALAFHVVLGAMFAAALGAHNSSEYSELETQCKMIQQAFDKCGSCACAVLNSCMQVDMSLTGSCPGCAAPPSDLCAKFDIRVNKILLAVTGPVTVFLMALPVMFSLLALLKVETASGITTSSRLARALAVVTQQISHLQGHQPLTVPLDELMEAVRELEAEGGPSLLSIASQCRAELARSGFNVPPRGSEDRKRRSVDGSPSRTHSVRSAAPSQHSAHSLAPSPHSGANLAANWRAPPQPAAMSFPTAAGRPESSIYYTPQPHQEAGPGQVPIPQPAALSFPSVAAEPGSSIYYSPPGPGQV